MNMINASVLLISAFFGLYGVASAIECGIVLKMLTRDKASRKLFTPIWEITNVFLVFGITSLVMLFNNALTKLSHDLLASLGVGLVAMLARACLILFIFYIKTGDKLSSWLVWLLALGTFVVPASFASAGIYLLTGQLFWHTAIGWVLMGACVVGLAAVGLLFAERRRSRAGQQIGRLSFAGWLFVLGCALPLSFLHSANYLQQSSITAILGLSAAGLLLMIVSYKKTLMLKLWHYGLCCAFAVPILLAWALRPYLIAGKLSLAEAYGAQSYGSIIIVGLAIMLPLIILGFYLFSRLFVSDLSDKN